MRSLRLAPSGARAALERACGSSTSKAITASIQSIGTKRAFSSLPQLRPSILPTTTTTTTGVFRAPGSTSTTLLSRLSPSTTDAATLDLVPRSAISAHPALAGAGVQVRCGPRATTARTSRLVRKRRHGFLSRIKTRNGRKTLQRRKDKKRSILSN
ncbi:hypothetical protein F5X96DRAFT_663509 [Biscogniauxia mediterranea]|nr:hypothetical protein F5X96DRAFT_663509 [Biscogniauxia mediterranea]